MFDRRVGLLGDADRPAWRAAGAAPLEGRFPRGYESGQVGDRPALREYSAGRGRKAGQFGDPAQRLILGVDRPGALEPRSGVDIRRADEHVERSCRLRRRTRDEGQVSRVVDGQAGRPEHVCPKTQRLVGSEPVGNHRRTGRGLELFGSWPGG